MIVGVIAAPTVIVFNGILKSTQPMRELLVRRNGSVKPLLPRIQAPW